MRLVSRGGQNARGFGGGPVGDLGLGLSAALALRTKARKRAALRVNVLRFCFAMHARGHI